MHLFSKFLNNYHKKEQYLGKNWTWIYYQSKSMLEGLLEKSGKEPDLNPTCIQEKQASINLYKTNTMLEE
jgi:hypothetical protein